MKQVLGWFAAAVALSSMVGNGAEEVSLDSLKEQRATLAVERKETEAKLQKRRQELEKSRDMAAANADVEMAGKTLDKALVDDSDLKAARAKLADARKNLDGTIADATDGSDDAKALDVQRAELEAKVAALRFRSRLLDTQLNHWYSPAHAEVEADATVKKARQAYADLDAEMREKPVPAVAAAGKALADLWQQEREIWKKLAAASRELESATADEKTANEALRKAQSEDKRPADLVAARMALEDARAAAFSALSAAKPLLAELTKIEKEVAAVEADRRATKEMLDMFRDKIRDGNDMNVSKAREAAAAADKACEAAEPADTRDLGAARKAAWDAYDAKRQEVRKAQEDKDLAARRAAAEKDIGQLKEKLLAGKSVHKEMAVALKARAEIDQKLRELDKEPKSKEAQAGLEEENKLSEAFVAAKAQHMAKLETVPSAVRQSCDALAAARKAAKRALAAAVETCLATCDEAKPVRSLSDDLAALRRGQDYRLAVLRFKLYDAMSPMAQVVAQQPDVSAAAAKVAEIERAIREKPMDCIVKAEKSYAEARSKREKIENELRQDAAYAKAVHARQTAEKALREAQAADVRGKAAADARAAIGKLVAEKIRAVPAGAALAFDLEKVPKEILTADQAIRGVAEKKNELRRAVERGENPKVALAKKAVSDAEAAVRATEQSGKITSLRKAVEDARKAREVRFNEVVGKDKECLKLVEEMGVNAEVEKTLAEQIRAKEKAAQDAAKKSAAPAPTK